LCAAFAKSQRASTAGVDYCFRMTVFPQEIAALGAFVLQLWAAGAKYLNRDALRAAGLRRS
jgi:hypothetical protein